MPIYSLHRGRLRTDQIEDVLNLLPGLHYLELKATLKPKRKKVLKDLRQKTVKKMINASWHRKVMYYGIIRQLICDLKEETVITVFYQLEAETSLETKHPVSSTPVVQIAIDFLPSVLSETLPTGKALSA